MIAIEISGMESEKIVTTLTKKLVSQSSAYRIQDLFIYFKGGNEYDAINVCRMLSADIGRSPLFRGQKSPAALIHCSYIDPFTAKMSFPLTKEETEFLTIQFKLDAVSIWMSMCEWELITEICWALRFLETKKVRALNPRNEWQDINILQLHAITALECVKEGFGTVYWDMVQDGEFG